MKNRSLNFKLLAGGTLCILIPLLVFGIFTDSQLSRTLKATNEQIEDAKKVAATQQEADTKAAKKA